LEDSNAKLLRARHGILTIALLLSGCAALQVGSEIQSGRSALMYGDPKVAAAHFERAAQLDPDYLYFSALPQGVWTYVGRAYYGSGRFPEARKAFEQALSRHDHDNLARLYLGLALAREGERQRGLREMESGMRRLHDWLEDITYNTRYGIFWDPRSEIRSEIERSLGAISGRDFDWPKLIASAEWVGEQMEQEIDRARRDEMRQRDRERDRHRGLLTSSKG